MTLSGAIKKSLPKQEISYNDKQSVFTLPKMYPKPLVLPFIYWGEDTGRKKKKKGTLMHPLDSTTAQAILANITHVYTDLDGTLLAPGGRLLTDHLGNPSTKLAEALVLLKRAGIEVIIVTGRDVASSTEIMRLTNLDQFIAEMGCIIQFGYGATAQKSYHLGEWTTKSFAEGFGHSVPITPHEMVKQSGILEILFNRFKGRLEEHVLPDSTREVTYLLRGHVDAAPGGEADCILAGFDLPLQMLDNGIIHPKNHSLSDVDEIHIYHLMPRGTGKGQAVAFDIATKSLKPEQTLAIGDAMGDIAMGTATGSFVLVNNHTDSGLEGYAASILTNPATAFATTLPNASGWTEFAHALLATRNR